MRWRVPRLWAGETCAIFAGGPSLTQDQVDRSRGLRTIAINNSHELAPWADVLYFCDKRWYEWHTAAVRAFAGLVVTLENYDIDGVHHLHNMGRDGLYLEPDGLMTGRNSGIQAINLAVHFGVRRILLLGYDMRVVGERTHWHGGHPRVQNPNVYRRAMLPCFETLVAPLADLGVKVVNCTPDSALQTFPCMPLEEALNADRVLDPA